MQDFYGKVCVAGSIKFVADEKREERAHLRKAEKFSCNLATILARDKEVVAVGVRLFSDKCIVYISKNSTWNKKDDEYINKIKNCMKKISKDAPKLDEAWEREDVGDLFEDIIEYCSAKFETRLEKLVKDMNDEPNEKYILSFKNAISTKFGDINDVSYYQLSEICSTYYKKTKKTTTQEITAKYLRFLRHLKKLGSYYTAFVNITICACNNNYKKLFSNMDVHKLDPVRATQRISSWKKIIQMFTQEEYEKFKERCLDDHIIRAKLREIYDDQLDEEISQHIYLHAELNVLTKIVDQKYKSRTFLAVSKKCCYLCDLYIKFARSKGYNIITTGTHNKIYHRWMLPNPKDTTFGKDAQSYIIANLNIIIIEEIANHTAISDDEEEIIDSVASRLLHDIIKTKSKLTTRIVTDFDE